MKMMSKIYFILSSLILSCNVAQAMEVLKFTPQQVTGVINIIGAQMAHDLPEEDDIYWDDAVSGAVTSFQNSPTTMLNELWNNPLAQAEMRGVIIDAYCELTKFYAWAFNQSNFNVLKNRIINLAIKFSASQFKSHDFQDISSKHISLIDFFSCILDTDKPYLEHLNEKQKASTELYLYVLNTDNYTHYHNYIALNFSQFLNQMSTIISIAYGDKPDPDIETLKKLDMSPEGSSEDSSDEFANLLKDFVGTHDIAGIIDNALIKLIALNKYLTIIANQTNDLNLQREIKKGLELINKVARGVNTYSDGNYIDRHFYSITEDQDEI